MTTAQPITEWQVRCGQWTDSRFPSDTRKDRGLILGEEGGEVLSAALDVSVVIARVQRCILKGDQDIRGGRDHWDRELRKEAAQAFFALCALAHRAEFDLSVAIDDEWTRQRDKQYVTGAQDGGQADG